MADIVFKSNLDLVLRMMHENNAEAAGKAADIAVAAVQEKMLYGYSDVHGRPPHTEIVDTERLFDSITSTAQRVSQNSETVTVGTDVPYARYVHEGYTQPAGLVFQGSDGSWHTTKGGHIRGRPFLADGLKAAKPDLEKAVGDAWKKGFNTGKHG